MRKLYGLLCFLTMLLFPLCSQAAFQQLPMRAVFGRVLLQTLGFTNYYVDQSVTSSGNGLSWGAAKKELREALALSLASGDNVYVATGTYKPTSSTSDRNATFPLKAGVKIYGGYQAGGTGVRNITLYVTTLSGDIDSNDTTDGLGDCVLNGNNSYNVVTGSSNTIGSSSWLDGFTVRAGKDGDGAGIRLTNSASPQIKSCYLTCNYGSLGGGAYVNSNSTCTFDTCTFYKNRSDGGAGVFLDLGSLSNILLNNCTFELNAATTEGGGTWCLAGRLTATDCRYLGNSAPDGGGLIVNTVSVLRVSHSLFQLNSCSFQGGGIKLTACPDVAISTSNFISNTAGDNVGHFGDGGAIWSYATTVTKISDCTFSSNKALPLTSGSSGGAIIDTADSVDSPGAIIRDCIFSQNECGGPGGAVRTFHTQPIIVNSQFKENHANSGAAIGSSSESLIVNCQFFGNTTYSEGIGGVLWTEREPSKLVNCVMAYNTAKNGGAIAFGSTGNEIYNCTIAYNQAIATSDGGEGGGIQNAGSSTLIANSILFYNTAVVGSNPAEKQIYEIHTPTIRYSDVQHNIGSVHSGTQNINLFPLFSNVNLNNFRLTPCSPCIDAGLNSDVQCDAADVDLDLIMCAMGNSEDTRDIDINVRVVDFPPTTGAVVDMGSYELAVPSCSGIAGDMNNDGLTNGKDIQNFTNCILDDQGSLCPCADMNKDNHVGLEDVPCFVTLLLTGINNCNNSCNETRSGGLDCNGDGEPDEMDILLGISQDCNVNGIPDECDISATTSNDVNSNNVPDECELDCNDNNIPDAWDISVETSPDQNGNGIPDECDPDCNGNDTPDDYDIAELISADCNENGIPDECEQDCNENGVPDDCDINPADPDGDEWVSFDCNGNGYPDECDLTLPPGFGSLDCNENGVPDECDIASHYSADSNNNHIPDECEVQGFQGNAMMQSGEGGGNDYPCASLTEEECWDVFWEWSLAQCWGPNCELSGYEQYEALTNKLNELGLSLENLVSGS